METHAQRRRRARGPVSGGIEAFSAGKPETGFEHPGATFDAPALDATKPGFTDAGIEPAAQQPPAIVTVCINYEPTPVNAIGMSRQERLQALERHLLRPFPHPTEFYLIDRLDRLTGDTGRYADLDELITYAAQPESVCPFRLGMVLSAAVRAGALEKIGPQTGREGSYRITAAGQRYLDQAKAMRVALWKINPLLSIGEICAIVQVEGGDTLSEMITRGKDEEALKAERRRQEKRAAKKSADQSLAQGMQALTAQAPAASAAATPEQPPATIPAPIHPLWAGLTAPLQNHSYPNT